jgi:hypothetical protein
LLEKLERESGISSNESQDLVRGANQKCDFVGLEYYNSLFIYLGEGGCSVFVGFQEMRVEYVGHLCWLLVEIEDARRGDEPLAGLEREGGHV